MPTVKYLHLVKSFQLADSQWASLDDVNGEGAHIDIPEQAEIVDETRKQIPQKVEFDISFMFSGDVHAHTTFKFVLVLEDYSTMEGDEPLIYTLARTENVFETEQQGTQFWQVRGSAVIVGKPEYNGEEIIGYYRKLEPHIFVSKADVTIEEVAGIFKFLSPDEV